MVMTATAREVEMIEELKMRGVTIEDLYRIGMKVAEVKPRGAGEVKILIVNRAIHKIPITIYD